MRNRAIACLIAAVACSNASVALPPTPGGGLYEGASEVAALDATSLMDESSDADALGDLFDDAGFGGALARSWAGERGGAVRLVEVRAHRFASATGATSFLEWIEEHPEDLIGAADQVRSSDGTVVFTHVPGGCCPNKDTSSVLQAWASGDLVWTVVVMGPSATGEVADGIRVNVEGGGAA